MVQSNFRSYQLSIQVFRQAKTLRLPAYLKDQLLRASSSVVLNLAEGSGKDSTLDRKRFFTIAMGSVREVQAILELADNAPASLVESADHLGASVFKLCRAL